MRGGDTLIVRPGVYRERVDIGARASGTRENPTVILAETNHQAVITGADLVLGVAEPSLSGIHDMQRVAGVASRFGIRMCCVVNRYDINEDNTRSLEKWCAEHDVSVLGRIPFDEKVIEAMVAGRPVVEYGSTRAGDEIAKIWQGVRSCLGAM